MLKKNLTPAHLRCLTGRCPAVYQLDDGKLAIIGKKVSPELAKELQIEVADDECVVLVRLEHVQPPTPGARRENVQLLLNIIGVLAGIVSAIAAALWLWQQL